MAAQDLLDIAKTPLAAQNLGEGLPGALVCPHQMMKQPGADLKAQRVLQNKNNERAGRGRRDFDQEEERESKPEYEQEIDVPSGDDLVNCELHVEGGGEDKNLGDHRQNQYLH